MDQKRGLSIPEVLTALREGATPRKVEQYVAKCRELDTPASLSPLYAKLARRWDITAKNAQA